MTEKGQTVFAQGFVRPAVPGVQLPEDVARMFKPATQVRPLDLAKAAERQAEVNRLWAAAVLGN
jgi:putative spermidine/putrescine transport system substrate-binding protein